MKKLLLLLCYIAIPKMWLAAQPKGYAILIGTESTTAGNYPSFTGISIAADISMMQRICEANNYKTIVMQNNSATFAKVMDSINAIGSRVKNGDYFLFYFSGHGDIKPDKNKDEKDGMDEVLVLQDKYLYDDSINVFLTKYFSGTNNIMIIDACNSGTSYKNYLIPLDHNSVATQFMLSAANIFHNTTLQQKSNKNYTCIFEDDAEDEPYSLIYMGATPDGQIAWTTGYSSVLTQYLYDIYTDATEMDTWNKYDFRSLSCDVGKRMMLSNNALQYLEIGNATNKYNHFTPFKLK